MKSVMKICLLALLVSSLSACGQKKLTPNTDGPDILMARDCGLDKLQCCAEDPACSYAQQCCVDPNDSDRNYCSDQCTCGSEGEFCCKGDKCNNGLTCFEGNCTACGGKDQPCCNGTGCGNNLLCSNEKCVECGVTGNPCCADNKCNDQIKKDKNRSECSEGACKLCGSNGNLACHGDPKCLAGNLFSNDNCYQCGGNNEPCCDQTAGTGYDCNPKLNLKCNLGFCSPVK